MIPQQKNCIATRGCFAAPHPTQALEEAQEDVLTLKAVPVVNQTHIFLHDNKVTLDAGVFSCGVQFIFSNVIHFQGLSTFLQ